MAWTTPTSRSTGELITQSIWNADLVANLIELRAGGFAISGQAANRIPYASSTTQLATSANLTFNGTSLTIAGSGGSIIFPSSGFLLIDGGGDTYLHESSANVMEMVAGAAIALRLSATGATFFGTAAVAGDANFGTTSNFSWVSKTKDTVYQAASDGFVLAYGTHSGAGSSLMQVLTDASNPPTTARQSVNNILDTLTESLLCPVKKGDYYKLFTSTTATFTVVMFWVPMGLNG